MGLVRLRFRIEVLVRSSFPRTIRRLTIGAAAGVVVVVIAVVAGSALTASAGSSAPSRRHDPTTTTTTKTTPTTPTPATTVPVAVLPAHVFNTGNAQLDALLPTLPPVLFEGGAQVHYGYNPVDCCHAGGYNPGPNEVWVGPSAFTSSARLTYVVTHELGHSLHLHTTRGPALTAAVAGAPSVRAGSPWDVSEKVADCVAWALQPEATAASGITYWSCPDPWRAQVSAALR
jgi:hypothetical protein